MNRPTITLLTPRGRGAVATLRFEGPVETLATFFTAANGKPLSEQPINRIVFGLWGREVPEEIVLCRTADTITEIHCHGGEAASGRIQRDLQSQGSQRETWQDMLDRTEGTFQREWIEAISKTTTQRTAGILLCQRKLFPQAIAKLQQLLEAGDSFAQPIQDLLDWAEFGLHLWKPWEVALGGPPNVGKSSLINALVGYARSIVFDQPGTTRDIVTAETAFAGWPVRLADTAGLREGADILEAEGIERAKKRLRSADYQLLLWDASQPPTKMDLELRREFPKAILIAHKCDLPGFPADDIPANAIAVSSLTGEGVKPLAEKLIARLILQVPPQDQAVPFTTRQIERLSQAYQAAIADDIETLRTVLEDLV